MILYLRNERNRTVVDVELYTLHNWCELNSLVCIDTYSELLLTQESKAECIKDFQELQELRGWLHETKGIISDDIRADKYDVILKELVDHLKMIAEKYKLYFIEK